MTGRTLKERIDALGITQRKLAELIGVTPQTINAILTAKDVRTSTIERIASVTNMPIGFFFSEEPDKQSAVANGDGSVAVTGNNNVAGNVTMGDNTAVLQERVKFLEQQVKDKESLLEEKERLIKVLMENKYKA